MNNNLPLKGRLKGGVFILGSGAIHVYYFERISYLVGLGMVGAIVIFCALTGPYFLLKGPIPCGPRYVKRFGLFLQKLADDSAKDENN